MIREQDFFIVKKAVVKFSPEKAEEFYTEHKGMGQIIDNTIK